MARSGHEEGVVLRPAEASPTMVRAQLRVAQHGGKRAALSRNMSSWQVCPPRSSRVRSTLRHALSERLLGHVPSSNRSRDSGHTAARPDKLQHRQAQLDVVAEDGTSQSVSEKHILRRRFLGAAAVVTLGGSAMDSPVATCEEDTRDASVVSRHPSDVQSNKSRSLPLRSCGTIRLPGRDAGKSPTA